MSVSEPSNLAGRVRRLRLWTLAAVVLSVSGGLLSAVGLVTNRGGRLPDRVAGPSSMVPAPHEAADNAAREVWLAKAAAGLVEAERLVLRNKDGQVRATMSSESGGFA